MYSVNLRKPASLNILGYVFKKNEKREDIPDDIAEQLMENDRFTVKRISERVIPNPANKGVKTYNEPSHIDKSREDPNDTSPQFPVYAAQAPAEEAPADQPNDDKRPSSKDDRIAAIQLAVAGLDRENDAHFTNAGKPDARALTQILGWQVTSQERDEAMTHPDPELQAKVGEAAEEGDGTEGSQEEEPTEENTNPDNTPKVKLTLKPKAETTKPDPTTGGAIEV